MSDIKQYSAYLREYLQRNTTYPRSIFVEVTPLCNLRCVFCPCYISGEEVTKDRKNTYLSLEDFKKIVEPIVGKFNFQICFTYSGEPLLNKEIFKMVKYLKHNNIPVVIHSNAMLLTKERIKEMLDSGLDRYIVSFDGATKKTYEDIRRGGDFEVVINNLKDLINERLLRGLAKPFVEMQMVLTSTNIKETKIFEDISNDIGVDNHYLKTLLVFQDTKNQKYVEDVKEYFVEDNVARYKKDENGNLILKDRGGCPEIQNCVITCDGDVVICCFDVHGKYCFGNAIEESLQDIWDSKKYAEFRKNVMHKRNLPICEFCNTSEHIKK